MTGSNPKNRFVFFLSILVIAFSACDLENVNYSDVPYLEFKELKAKDSIDILENKSRLVTLHLYLIDGKGDIGDFPCFDGTEYYPGNCLIQLHYYNGDKYVYDSTFPKAWFPCYGDSVEMRITEWYTIPPVGDLGQDKALKADVFIDISYTVEPQNSYKKYFYKVTVFDAKLNRSNTLITDTIIME
ncbi:MAG: hypothetical protein WCX31_03755 [Salinivirgaceae bacterium]|jgi:hypothetical protein